MNEIEINETQLRETIRVVQASPLASELDESTNYSLLRARATELAGCALKLLEDNRALMKLPPFQPCEVCGAASAEWCRPGCSERPQPKPTSNDWGTLLGDMITMLASGIDEPTTRAKNYVEMTFNWSHGVLPHMPFRRVAMTFFRDGGLSPHERAEAAIREAAELKERNSYLEKRIEDITVENYRLQVEGKAGK